MAWFLAFKNAVQSILQSKTVTAGTSASIVTPDTGYDGLSDVTVNPTPSESKTETAGTTQKTVTPTSGKLLSSVVINPTPSQTKSATPTTSTQTVSPDSGYLLSSVSVGAIQTQEKTVTAGTSAASVTPDSGKYLSKVTYNPTPSQEKTTTPTTRSSTAATVTPDSGKLLSKVTVNTTSVPNSNSGTYTFPANDTGGTKDLGETNTYRYVNAQNVYNKGKADGQAAGGMTLLYTNPNSSAEYTPFDVNLDLSNYNGVIITYKNPFGIPTASSYVPKGSNDVMSVSAWIASGSSHDMCIYRNVSVTNSGVSFGYKMVTNGTYITTTPGYDLVDKIYGV